MKLMDHIGEDLLPGPLPFPALSIELRRAFLAMTSDSGVLYPKRSGFSLSGYYFENIMEVPELGEKS